MSKQDFLGLVGIWAWSYDSGKENEKYVPPQKKRKKEHILYNVPTTLSVKRNLSLLQSDIHWNPVHQNDSYWDTD